MLSLGVKRGFKIMIGESKMRVVDVPSSTEIMVVINGGHPKRITDKEMTEVLPEVKCTIGYFPAEEQHDHYARLLFSAPRSISIQRVRRAKGPQTGGSHGHPAAPVEVDG